jgi:hypothetical protein
VIVMSNTMMSSLWEVDIAVDGTWGDSCGRCSENCNSGVDSSIVDIIEARILISEVYKVD